MDLSANWIWTTLDDAKRNFTACARRVFSLDNQPAEALLDISADSRYVLYINGRRVGQGPARSWNHFKQYDTYEVSEYLCSGRNVIAVQVVRWGITNGRYIGGPGGLIAQLTLNGDETPFLITDSSWKMGVHTGFRRNVPRLAWGQAYTEQYDARLAPEGWTSTNFDDSAWIPATVLGPVGTDPWLKMEKRDIPMLTEEPVYPVRVFDACAVQPPSRSYHLDLYDAVRGPETSYQSARQAGVIIADLNAESDGEVVMIRMNASANLDTFDSMRINGEEVAFREDRATFSVRRGSNLLAAKFTNEGQSQPSWVFKGEVDVQMLSPVAGTGGPAAIYSTKDPEDAVLSGIWNASNIGELSDYLPKLRPVKPEESLLDVFALSNTREMLEGVEARIDSPQAICSVNSESATAYSPSQGDLEFLLDFGTEIVGFPEFEIDASEGTIIDLNCFEIIVNGEWNWTDNLNNTLRYTAREGWQRFTSTVRRGFRFMQVTIRNASRPVRIRQIRCIQNTYPVLNEGAFKCSDALLTSIWEIGRRTTRLCMEDTFVDCPAYEQTFWVGDSRNEALTTYAAFGDTRLVKHCMRLAAQSLWRSPLPECAVPAGYGGIIPDWSMFWVLACEEYIRHTGDLQFAKSIRPPVLQTCRFLISCITPIGLMRYAAWNMLDWAPMDSPSGGINTHENALMVETLRRGAEIMDAAGENEGSELRSAADKLVKAMNEYLWDEGKQAYIDSFHIDGERSTVFSQQTQTMVYLCNIVPSERIASIERYISDVPEGWVPIGSPWMMEFSFEALAKCGSQQAILDWMRKYWGQMLEMDATTCWETFPVVVNGRWKPTRSWCHAWSTAPTYFLSTYQLGARVMGPGKVQIAPEPCDLTWAWGRVPTVKGTVSVSWKIKDGKFNMSVILPSDVEAEVLLPAGYEPGEISVRKSAVSTSPMGV